MKFSWRSFAALAAAGLILGAGGGVQAMTVQPVAADLSTAGRDTSAPIRVENNGPNPLPVEVRLVETDFTPDGVRASDRSTDDVIAFPPQAIIPPGGTQVFRLQYVGEPAAEHSKHYYAEVAQLPVELPEGQSAIQILYNFQVMVNVASPTAGPPDLSVVSTEIATNADKKPVVAFTVKNGARNYGYLSANSLTIRQVGADGKELMRKTLAANDIQQQIGFGLVGPETTRRFVTPILLDSTDGKLEVTLGRSRGR